MDNMPYSNVVSIIMYTILCTRRDIVHVISNLNRFMANPGPELWFVLKWLLRRLKGSSI